MNRHDFEIRNFQFRYEFDDNLYFEFGDTWQDNNRGGFLEVNIKTNKIKIITTDLGYNQDGPNWSIKFNGHCPDIATFDLICKLIGI